jgi:hypothetical protein
MGYAMQCDYCGQTIEGADASRIYEWNRGTVRVWGYLRNGAPERDVFHFHTDRDGEGTDCLAEALSRLCELRAWAQRDEKDDSNLEWRLAERDPARLPVGREPSRNGSATAPPPLTQSHGLYWLEDALQPAPMHALYRAGIRTIGDLVKLSREDLLAVLGVGAKSVRAIEQSLADYGVTLSEGAVA